MKLKIFLLSVLVLLGLTKPLMRLTGFQTNTLNVLNLSPGSIVFSDFRFFTFIKLTFLYPDKEVSVPTAAIIDTPETDLYRGKLKYSLLYMDHIFPKRRLSENVARFYFCHDRLSTLKELSITPPMAVRIEYVDRQTNETRMERKYSCNEERSKSI